MATRLTDYEVLEAWLGFLQEKAVALVGTGKDAILQTVRKQALLQKEQFYCLECPLQGEPQMDFSLQYRTKEFLEARDSVGDTSFRYGRFINLYGQIVGPDKNVFLEFDNIKGVGLVAALFLDILNVDAEKVIQRTMAFQAEVRRMPRIMEILKIADKYELVPANLGFIYSRLNGPLRLTFSIPLEVLLLPSRYDSFAYFVQELEIATQSETIRKAFEKNPEQLRQLLYSNPLMQDLVALSNFDYLDCFLDIDIYPDGRVGDMFGIEIVPCIQSATGQRELLVSQDFADFIFFLQRIGVIDERIVCLADCILSAELAVAQESQGTLLSMISHFKLRYKQGKRLPTMVYIKGHRIKEE